MKFLVVLFAIVLSTVHTLEDFFESPEGVKYTKIKKKYEALELLTLEETNYEYVEGKITQLDN